MRLQFSSIREIVFAAGLFGASIATAADTRSSADLKKAADLFPAGKSEEARSILDKVIEADPKNAKAYGLRGVANRNLGDPDTAMADFDKAIELNPKLAQPYVDRAALWADQKDIVRIKADIDQAIKVDPKYAPAYSSRGVVRRIEGKLKDALDDQNKAIQLDPKFARAYVNRSELELMQKDASGAEADAKKAVDLSPANAATYVQRAKVAWDARRDWHSAIVDLSRAIRLSPKVASYYFERGRMRAGAGDVDLALRDANVAVMLDPSSVDNLRLRAAVLLECEDWWDAIDDLNQCITRDPKNYDFRFQRGHANLQLRNRAALDDFDKAIELKPDSGKAYGYRSYVHYWWKEDEAAQKDYDHALQLDPTLKGEIDMMRSFADEHSPKRTQQPRNRPAPQP
jgi:tetratricopeptide (TPR) repeat protein